MAPPAHFKPSSPSFTAGSLDFVRNAIFCYTIISLLSLVALPRSAEAREGSNTPTNSPTIPPTTTPSRSVSPAISTTPRPTRTSSPSRQPPPSASPSTADLNVSAGNPRFYAIFFPSLTFFVVIVLGLLLVVLPLALRAVRAVKKRRIRYHRPGDDTNVNINDGIEEWSGTGSEGGDDRRHEDDYDDDYDDYESDRSRTRSRSGSGSYSEDDRR